MPKNNSGTYSNILSGKYNINGREIFFRSKWEANYALYLDWLKERGEIQKWEYEADVFIFHAIELGTRSYCPDFKVFGNDGTFVYHEVKGYMSPTSKTKLRRMKKYYPNEKVILIQAPEYTALKKWSKMLGWY